MRNYTTYLTPTSSFLTGAASAFNLAGNFYQYNLTGDDQLDDYLALRADWMAVGEDMRNAMSRMNAPAPVKAPRLILRLKITK